MYKTYSEKFSKPEAWINDLHRSQNGARIIEVPT